MSKLIQNTLDNVEIRNERRCGNSTRQIDRAIDIIFSPGEICEVRDHWQHGTNKESNQDLFYRICRRLEIEHHLSKMIEDKIIRIDKDKLEIELL